MDEYLEDCPESTQQTYVHTISQIPQVDGEDELTPLEERIAIRKKQVTSCKQQIQQHQISIQGLEERKINLEREINSLIYQLEQRKNAETFVQGVRNAVHNDESVFKSMTDVVISVAPLMAEILPKVEAERMKLAVAEAIHKLEAEVANKSLNAPGLAEFLDPGKSPVLPSTSVLPLDPLVSAMQASGIIEDADAHRVPVDSAQGANSHGDNDSQANSGSEIDPDGHNDEGGGTTSDLESEPIENEDNEELSGGAEEDPKKKKKTLKTKKKLLGPASKRKKTEDNAGNVPNLTRSLLAKMKQAREQN